ncbi:MAG: glycosyltransferase [Mycobacteriaceae bacterium]|nr:glycosyltransferase [Mycobacteriaceae bacterium]
MPTICLNMIVRNEAHIIREALDSVAPYITSWVIVDTGSDDGTQALIKRHMADLDIPGELHERPWHNFGHNRTEALHLAKGHGDYILMMDADDKLVGTPDFSQLSADIYALRITLGVDVYWRPHLFRDQARVRYEGVTHECATWDETYSYDRLQGDYHIEARTLGGRNLDPRKYERDRDLLLAEVERNPADSRSVFYLAQSYFDLGDFVNAQKWYAQRTKMGGFVEEVYYALFRVALCMSNLGTPWPDVQDAYLKAWNFRPTRAEPLYFIALWYRRNQEYQLGYLFAKLATEIPFPTQERLFVGADIYTWCAADERAVCASWIGKRAEAFTLWRQLLAQADIPDQDRQRITKNRDLCVPAMIDMAAPYPDTALVQRLIAYNRAHRQRGPREVEVTVSLISGPDLQSTERTLNSFLRCCTDITRVGRFLVLDVGLSAQDRAALMDRYRFVELTHTDSTQETKDQIAHLRTQINGRFWMHLSQGWQFFAPENFIGRLIAVLQAEPQVFQVGVNFADATRLIGVTAPENVVRRAPDTGRYVLTTMVAHGPAMYDLNRPNQATASLDEVLCITGL